MKENVGKTDQIVRSLVDPGLITFGYAGLGGNKGHLSGLVAIMIGTLLTIKVKESPRTWGFSQGMN